MLDIILILFIIGMAIWGFKAGLVRTIFHFGYYIISAIVAAIVYPVLSNFIMKTPIATFIHDKIIMPNLKTSTPTINISNMPTILKDIIEKPINANVKNAMEATANSLTQTLVSIICIIIVFLIVRFGVRFIVEVLNSIANLPILSPINKLGGLVIGSANGFIVVYLILAIATLFMTAEIHKLINTSEIVKQMYNDNLLIKLIFK